MKSLFSEELIQNPYDNYRVLRNSAPIYFEDKKNLWALTKYENIFQILKNHDGYSSKSPISFSPSISGSHIMLLSNDQPDHTRLKALVSDPFLTAGVKRIESWVKESARDLIKNLGDSSSEIDVVAHFTLPLPISVIAKLLGIPPKDWKLFKYWSTALTGNLFQKQEQFRAVVSMYHYFHEVIRKRKANPRDDIVSKLSHARVDGEPLTESEIQNFCLTLLVAGNETTTGLLSNILNILADNPTLWESMRDDRLLVPKVVEETLRYDSPIQMTRRVAINDSLICDHYIKRGESLLLVLGAANRDPAIYINPDKFDPNRERARHLAFSSGIHYCLGSVLTRVEAELAINLLLDEFRSISRKRKGDRLRNFILRGFNTLPLCFYK